MQDVDSFDRRTLQTNNEIPFLQASLCRRAARLRGKDQSAGSLLNLIMSSDRAINWSRLRLHPDVAATHHSVPNQLASDELCGIDRDGEAQALRWKNCGSIDPDHLAGGVNQRAAGIARIQGRVGLDDVFDQPSRLR